MGINRVTTYGIYYADWNNHLVLRELEDLLEHWHRILFGSDTPSVMTRTILSYSLQMSKGDSISIYSKSGCHITTEEI